MPTVSPIIFDESTCQYRAVRNGETLDLLSAEDTNLLDTGADGKVTLDAADLVSSIECNVLSVELTDSKLKVCPADLISTVDGGNVIGVNPDDHKLYINPCLIPGPQNIVSNKEDNIIQRDPDDCSAYLNAVTATEEIFATGAERMYFGPGLVYAENQDGTHQLRAAICRGLTTNNAVLTDGAGIEHSVKAIEVALDPEQNVLYFAENSDQCQDCLSVCDTLSIDFSLNASGTKLRLLDHGGAVFSQINLSNGLQGDGSGGLTINTLDSLASTAPNNDLPISSKAVKEALDALARVAYTGDYADLINKPTFARVATTGSYNDLVDKPNFATVATTGDYNDLINKPSIPSLNGEIADGETDGVTGDTIYNYIQQIIGGGSDDGGVGKLFISASLGALAEFNGYNNYDYRDGSDIGINQRIVSGFGGDYIQTTVPNDGSYLIYTKYYGTTSADSQGGIHTYDKFEVVDGGTIISVPRTITTAHSGGDDAHQTMTDMHLFVIGYKVSTTTKYYYNFYEINGFGQMSNSVSYWGAIVDDTHSSYRLYFNTRGNNPIYTESFSGGASGLRAALESHGYVLGDERREWIGDTHYTHYSVAKQYPQS